MMKRWRCKTCGSVVIAENYPNMPMFSDGHKCDFEEEQNSGIKDD